MGHRKTDEHRERQIDLWNIKASDKIRAIEVLAKLHGWNAPEKTNSGESKIERIEWVISNLKSRRRRCTAPADEGKM